MRLTSVVTLIFRFIALWLGLKALWRIGAGVMPSVFLGGLPDGAYISQWSWVLNGMVGLLVAVLIYAFSRLIGRLMAGDLE